MRLKHRLLPIITVAVLAMMGHVAGATTATTKSKTKPAKAGTVLATTTKPRIKNSSPTSTTAAATTATATTTVAPVSGTINVSAAQSLTASFGEIAKAFEKVNPEAKVVLNFAGSSTLVTQIKNGAPADVFASADTANMAKLVDAKLVENTPQIFTRNRLMIVVPRGNPQAVKSLADLSREEVFVGLGAVGVPAGDYAREILTKAGVTLKPKTLESNVTAIVNKIALREIDAGMVYVTDVALDEYRVDGIAIPDNLNVIATYPIATVSGGKQKATANAFIAFTRSPAGQAILKKYKFMPLS